MFRKYKSQSSKLEVMVCKWKWLVQVKSLLQTLDTNKANSQSQCPQFDRHEILFGPQAAGCRLGSPLVIASHTPSGTSWSRTDLR